MSVEVDEFAIVRTEFGQVRGRKIISEVDEAYWRFLGIPYAKSPVGDRRFQVKATCSR
jgi:carboxylesterase type B